MPARASLCDSHDVRIVLAPAPTRVTLDRMDHRQPTAITCLATVLGCGAPAIDEPGDSSSTAVTSSDDGSQPESGNPPTTAPPPSTSPPDDDDDGADDDPPTSDSAPPDDGTDDTAAEPMCPADGAGAGHIAAIELEHDGVMRTYDLYIPAGTDSSAPLPLVLNFHGLGSNPGQQRLFSLMDATSDEHGFVVAYPAGVGASWNAGTCCGQASGDMVDDVGFALAVIDDVQSRTCIDPKRVYATGMSNGGFMSHRLACEAADRIAAIAPVAGVIGVPLEDCAPSRPVPVLQMHGTLDILVPYAGNNVWPGAVETVEAWSVHNGCAGDPVETFKQADVTCTASESCDGGARTELCTIQGGGHCWPGDPICPLGLSTLTISASGRMAEFFAGFALP